MNTKSKVIYWTSTILLSLGMLSGGIGQILMFPSTVEGMVKLGYPLYFLTIIGICKIIGVIAILSPGLPLVKEWAYAGLFFLMMGATLSHMASGDPITEAMAPLFFLTLIVFSWRFRPVNRKILIPFKRYS